MIALTLLRGFSTLYSIYFHLNFSSVSIFSSRETIFAWSRNRFVFESISHTPIPTPPAPHVCQMGTNSIELNRGGCGMRKLGGHEHQQQHNIANKFNVYFMVINYLFSTQTLYINNFGIKWKQDYPSCGEKRRH